VNDAEPREASQHSNRSVNRALHLLRRVASTPVGATASELAVAVGLPRPTAFRLLTTLEENGLVDRIDGRYVLGGEVARLGDLADPKAGVAQRITPLVDEAAEKLGETLTYSVHRSASVLDVVVQADARRVGLSVSTMIGERWPLYASATGKLVLAELPPDGVRALLSEGMPALASRTITTIEDLEKELEQIRRDRFAIIDDELEDGIVAGAVPVRDDAGHLVGSLAVVGPKHRFDRQACLAAMPYLMSTAEQIAVLLGLRPPLT
jgi:DNA-binding IclR family transcriptional regulator